MTPSAGPAASTADKHWLCDVNVLVALALTTHAHHRAAHSALAALTGTWATCPMTEAALFRLLLNPRISGRVVTAAGVRDLLNGMRAEPRWRWVEDSTSLATSTIDLSVLQGHQQVTDLHLVNLAAAAGRVLVTFDAGLVAGLAPSDRKHVVVLPQ